MLLYSKLLYAIVPNYWIWAMRERFVAVRRGFERYFTPQPFDRRRRAYLAVGIVGTGLAVGGSAALHSPDKPLSSDQEPEFFIEPGWIERNIRSKFVQFEKGHFYWLREGVLNNPIVREATADLFQHLIRHKEQEKRLSLGEILEYAITHAHERLRHENQKSTSPVVRDNLILEATHVAMFAVAGVFATSWWSQQDLEKLGVSIDGYIDVNSFFWHTSGLGTIVYPRFFGVENEAADKHLTDYNRSPKYGGADRAVHVAQHMFLTFSYLYARHFRLPDHETIPNIMKLWVMLAGRMQAEKEAQALSDMIGWTYETVSTVDGIKQWLRDTSEPITEGRLDDMSPTDLQANAFGAHIGIALWKSARDEGFILERLLGELKDERFLYRETEPRLEASHGLFPEEKKVDRREFFISPWRRYSPP